MIENKDCLEYIKSLDDNSVDLIVDDSGTDTNYASFGSIVRIGDVANEHISASSAGIHIKDGSTVNTLINAKGATFGDTSNSHISMSTYDLTLKSADGTDRVNITNGSLSHFNLFLIFFISSSPKGAP